MRQGPAIALILATGLLATGVAAGGPQVMPTRYTFSFRLAPRDKPGVDSLIGKANGRGSGSFSIGSRRWGRDGTAYWQLAGARGTISLSSGGPAYLTAAVAGGTLGVAGRRASLTRSLLLRLRLTGGTWLHCARPNATLALQDVPLGPKTNSAGLQLVACGARLHWSGRPPDLSVSIDPA